MKDKTFNILVVDDSPDALELVKRNLESGDNNIITASNVNDALSVLADRPLDLVVLLNAYHGLDRESQLSARAFGSFVASLYWMHRDVNAAEVA